MWHAAGLRVDTDPSSAITDNLHAWIFKTASVRFCLAITGEISGDGDVDILPVHSGDGHGRVDVSGQLRLRGELDQLTVVGREESLAAVAPEVGPAGGLAVADDERDVVRQLGPEVGRRFPVSPVAEHSGLSQWRHRFKWFTYICILDEHYKLLSGQR